MLSVKYVFHIWQETNGWIVILKTVLKSDLWPGSEKCGFNPKLEDNDLKSGCYRVPKLPPLSVNYVCPISHETNHPIMIPKIVLKSVLWRGSESALNCCIFQLLCFSLHPIIQCILWQKKEDDSQYAVQIIIGSVRYSDSSVGRWNLKRSSRCAGKLPESLPSIELRSKDLFKMSSFWNKDNHVLFSSVHTEHASVVVSHIACLSLFRSFAFVYWGFVLVIKTGSGRVFFAVSHKL